MNFRTFLKLVLADIPSMILMSVMLLAAFGSGVLMGCSAAQVNTQPPKIPWRYGDKVIITHGFYSQQKAKIMGRHMVGNKWRYELWGDGEAAIDAHTLFDETEFVLREEQ